jgi:hypothetical protein
MASQKQQENTIVNQDIEPVSLDICEHEENTVVKPPAKKRGRKPKGGKIVQHNLSFLPVKEEKPNIILHLKCSMKDIHPGLSSDNTDIESFHFTGSNELNYHIISSTNMNELHTGNNNSTLFHLNEQPSMKEPSHEDTEFDSHETKDIWKKLKILEHNLHINNVSEKKSSCFWCSYDFDSPSIYIPKHFIQNSYHVYGCFCSPECAVAHLMEENIDSSTKFERYSLLNHIYTKIYDYKKNIKPAPNPYYMLERYYGNLTIQEYRALLKSERLFLIVDKPLTRILPEFHEDNDEFIINNKIIPSNNFHNKKKIQKKPQTKHTIMNEQFGITG